MKNKLCPVCKTHNILEEKLKDNINSYLCIKCGYTSNDEYKTNSNILNKQLMTSSKFIIDLQYFDEDTGLHWFPSVFININGLLFPDKYNNTEDWKWVYVPIVKIKKEDNIPEKYDTKVDTEKREYFDKLDFFNALKRFGAIEEGIKLSAH